MASFGCSRDETIPSPILREVRYVIVEGGDGSLERSFSGQVRAAEEANLSFQVAGRVASVPIKMGEKVKAGQIIAKLDDADYRIALEEARADLSQAQAEARSADGNYKRIKALYQNKTASVQDLDDALAARDSAASLARARAQAVQSRRRELDYTQLKAQTAGIVREVSVEENEVIASGQAVATIQAGDDLEVAFDLPETYVRRVALGMEVISTVPALDDAQLSGKITEIGVPRGSGAAYPVRVEVQRTAESEVEAGMAATVVMSFPPTARSKMGIFRIPAISVGEDTEGAFLYVAEPDVEGASEKVEGRVTRRSIEIGSIERGMIDVRSGLSGGERVITAGVNRIQDGLRVIVPPAPVDYTL